MPAFVLLDDLDNPSAARFDQDGAAVHNRITIFPSAVFRRYVVIGDAFLRQNRANSDVLAVLIRRPTLLDDVVAKAGTLVDAKNPGDATDHAANHTADDGADRSGCPSPSLEPRSTPPGTPWACATTGSATVATRAAIPIKRRIMMSPMVLGKVQDK
jgi:hypothetical protein